MALGLIFSRRELWTVVEADYIEDAIDEAVRICPFPDILLGIIPTRLPGFRNQWRIRFIYKGQSPIIRPKKHDGRT